MNIKILICVSYWFIWVHCWIFFRSCKYRKDYWSVFDKKIQFTSYVCAKVSKYYTRFVLLVLLYVCIAKLHLEMSEQLCFSLEALLTGSSHIETKPVCLYSPHKVLDRTLSVWWNQADIWNTMALFYLVPSIMSVAL